MAPPLLCSSKEDIVLAFGDGPSSTSNGSRTLPAGVKDGGSAKSDADSIIGSIELVRTIPFREF
jgi:hypothetical protein